jgi:hypothetical protein
MEEERVFLSSSDMQKEEAKEDSGLQDLLNT